MPRLLIIDGYGFVFRAYHSMPPLRRADGLATGALYGYTNMLYSMLSSFSLKDSEGNKRSPEQSQIDYVVVALDSKENSLRNEYFPEYKAHRPQPEEDLIKQLHYVRDVSEAMGLHTLSKPGYEADDIIASVVQFFKEINASQADKYEINIISSDKDLMQLVDDDVKIYDYMKSIQIGEAEVEAKFSVKPNQIRDYLALIGDASDGVPGVAGVGPKTASNLLRLYGTAQEVYQNLDKLTAKDKKEQLIKGKESFLLSQKLVTLLTDVGITYTLEDFKWNGFTAAESFLRFLEEFEFTSILGRAKKLVRKATRETGINIVSLERENLEQIFQEILEAGEIVIHKTQEGILFYIEDDRVFLIDNAKILQHDYSYFITKMLYSSSINKLFYDTKSFLGWFDGIHKNNFI